MHLNDASAKPAQLKQAGITFMLSGCAFLVASALAEQLSFIGVAAAMFGVGAAFIAKSRRKD